MVEYYPRKVYYVLEYHPRKGYYVVEYYPRKGHYVVEYYPNNWMAILAATHRQLETNTAHQLLSEHCSTEHTTINIQYNIYDNTDQLL